MNAKTDLVLDNEFILRKAPHDATIYTKYAASARKELMAKIIDPVLVSITGIKIPWWVPSINLSYPFLSNALKMPTPIANIKAIMTAPTPAIYDVTINN